MLTAAREAGATRAGYMLLRLPGPVKEVFEERLRAKLPLRAERVLHRIRETRGGELYDSRFGTACAARASTRTPSTQLFKTTARRLGLLPIEMAEDAGRAEHLPPARARRAPQLSLF